MSLLPWSCPKHPNAPVRHSWDQEHYVLNGYPAGTGINAGNDKYECNVCGTELAPPEKSPPHKGHTTC